MGALSHFASAVAVAVIYALVNGGWLVWRLLRSLTIVFVASGLCVGARCRRRNMAALPEASRGLSGSA